MKQENQNIIQASHVILDIPRVPFYFVRHGLTDWNLQGRFQGTTDIPLNDIGMQQAARAARTLENHGIVSICYSPLSRAKMTAEIIGNIQKSSSTLSENFAMYELDDIKERFGGSGEGKVKPENFNFAHNQPEYFFIDAESHELFLARIIRGVSRALELPGPVCLVSHGGVFRFLTKYLGIQTPSIGNAAIVQFIPQEDNWVMSEIERTQE